MSWPGAKAVVAQYPSRLKNIVKVLNGKVGVSQFCAHGVIAFPAITSTFPLRSKVSVTARNATCFYSLRSP